MAEPTVADRHGRASSVGRLVAVVLGASLLCLGLAAAALAAAGDLDPTFGGNGKITTDLTSQLDAAHGVAVQSDGSLVAVGVANGRNPRFALTRYNTDGTLDTTFGGDGKVTTAFELGPARAFDVAIQLDGKIVAAGVGGGTSLARYNTDGTLDTTFGDDGKVTINFLGGNQANALVIQADGRIVTAGVARLGADPRFALTRLNTDGTLDTTFGGDGKVTTDFDLGPGRALDVAIQLDGKIVAVGAGGGTALARYNADGTLDTTFGDGGTVTINFHGGNQANALVIQADGRIVTAGVARLGADPRFALTRFNADGTLDTTFGGDGKVTTAFELGPARAFDVAIQLDGKIVAAGVGGGTALARYNADGTLDTTFGDDGKVTISFHGGTQANALVIQADGRIVTAGVARLGSGARFALTRLLAS